MRLECKEAAAQTHALKRTSKSIRTSILISTLLKIMIWRIMATLLALSHEQADQKLVVKNAAAGIIWESTLLIWMQLATITCQRPPIRPTMAGIRSPSKTGLSTGACIKTPLQKMKTSIMTEPTHRPLLLITLICSTSGNPVKSAIVHSRGTPFSCWRLPVRWMPWHWATKLVQHSLIGQIQGSIKDCNGTTKGALVLCKLIKPDWSTWSTSSLQRSKSLTSYLTWICRGLAPILVLRTFCFRPTRLWTRGATSMPLTIGTWSFKKKSSQMLR